MKPDSQEMFSRLRDYGLRPTEARRRVLALLTRENLHLTTEGIMQALHNKGYPLSVATLYQNLNKLVEAGLLVHIKGPDGLMRFDANLAPHHHLVCRKCGKMVDVKSSEETLLKKHPLDFQSGIPLSDWQLEHIKIEFKGTCPDCKRLD